MFVRLVFGARHDNVIS